MIDDEEKVSPILQSILPMNFEVMNYIAELKVYAEVVGWDHHGRRCNNVGNSSHDMKAFFLPE